MFSPQCPHRACLVDPLEPLKTFLRYLQPGPWLALRSRVTNPTPLDPQAGCASLPLSGALSPVTVQLPSLRGLTHVT